MMGEIWENIESTVTACVEKIEHTDYNVNEFNTATSPVLFFYFGNTADEKDSISSLINSNWTRNARYIKHIGVSFKDNNYVITDLDNNASDNSKNNDDVMNQFVRQVLEAPIGTFPNNNMVRVKFILLTSDENSEKYLEFATSIDTELTTVVFKDLYLLMHEGGSTEDTQNTKFFIEKLYEYENNNGLEPFKNIIVLSDRLKNGQFIQKHEKKTSFRVIADAVLIMDSDDRNTDMRKMEKFYQGGTQRYKTLAHRIVRKPSFEIICVIFKTILKIILEEKAKDRETIRRMFEAEQFEEKYFSNKFSSTMPRANDFKYLPYTEEGKKNTENRFRSDKRNGRIHIDESILDNETHLCFGLFFEENYVKKIKNSFSNEDFTAALSSHFMEKYSYKDIKEHFRYEDIVDIACSSKEIRVEEEFSKSVYTSLERYCFMKAQNCFFELIRQSYLKTMKNMYDFSENFERVLIEAYNKISGMYFIRESGINNSIEEYYSEYTRDFYKANTKLFKTIFTIAIQNEQQLGEALCKIFGKMLLNDLKNQLTCGFKDELNHRLGTAATPEAKSQLIRNELQPNIEDYTRIHVKIDSIKEIYDAYLCSPNNDFLEKLGGNAEIFNTNDDNVFEHVKFYSFGSISDIYGRGTEGQ